MLFVMKHVTISPRRKGGLNEAETHSEWIQTVPSSPDVISMTFVPITSLLSGVPGNGFLSHAVNLYLRCKHIVFLTSNHLMFMLQRCSVWFVLLLSDKPPIEELRQFLEYQLPREWAPVFGELPLTLSRKEHSPSTLQFSLMGPKLKVNITPVLRCVSGLHSHLFSCSYVMHLSFWLRKHYILFQIFTDHETLYVKSTGNESTQRVFFWEFVTLLRISWL